MFSYGLLHIDTPVGRFAKTLKERERKSKKSMLSERHDDDDDLGENLARWLGL